MSKNHPSRSFEGSAARDLPPVIVPPHKLLRGREQNGTSKLPGELRALRADQNEEAEVTRIRRRIGAKMPSPGASAVLAIEQAKSLFSSKGFTEKDVARTRDGLVTSKHLLESAVLKAQATGNTEAASEYYGQIQDIERLLDVSENQEVDEIEDAMDAMTMKENAGKNVVKLSEYAMEKRDAVQAKIQPVVRELTKAKAELRKAFVEQSIFDEPAEIQRIDETLKKGGWAAFKLRTGDRLRQLSGSPSILDLRKKVGDLELKRDLLRGEMAEFTEMAHSTRDESTPVRTKTSKAELRRESERRETRVEPSRKTAELEEEMSGVDVDLSELELDEEEPIQLVKRKEKKAETPVALPKDILDLAEQGAKINGTKSKPVELDFEELEEAIEKQKKEPAKRRVPPPPASLQLEAREANRRMEMNVDKASALVPNAEALWVKANEHATPKTAERIHALEFGEDAQQTKLVFLVARYRDAKNHRAGAEELKKLRQTAERAAAILKINKDPEFLKGMGE